MVLVIILCASSFFFWTQAENTRYNDATRLRNQLEIARLNENVVTSLGDYTVINGIVNVTVKVLNQGAFSAKLVNIWAYDSATKTYGFNNSIASMTEANLNAGQTSNFTGSRSIKINVPGTASNNTIGLWFITSKGNSVPIIPQQTQITISTISRGIGVVVMDYTNFVYYNVTSSAPWKLSPNTPASGYVLPYGPNLAFRVSLSNFDPLKGDITLNSHSVLWMTLPKSSTANAKYPASGWWYIVNVQSDGSISPSFTNIVIPYGSTKNVYFASASDISFAAFQKISFNDIAAQPNQPAGISLMLIGTLTGSAYGAGTQYGQNIPGVSIFVVG